MSEIKSMDDLLEECHSLVVSYLSDNRLGSAGWRV